MSESEVLVEVVPITTFHIRITGLPDSVEQDYLEGASDIFFTTSAFDAGIITDVYDEEDVLDITKLFQERFDARVRFVEE